jgi:hypothetical protein
MRKSLRRTAIALLATTVALSAGCAAPVYVYKPSAPGAGGPRVEAGVAVLPFEDGTENFTKRGSAMSDGQYNLARAGISGGMTAMPPQFWGKSFADELLASGTFPAARFVYSPSEVRDETLLVDGVLKKVIFAATFDYSNELQVLFRAARRSDGKVVWQKEIVKAWKTPKDVYAGCGMGMDCMFGKMHADWNRWMGAMLSEARTDLAAAVASGGEGTAAGTPEGGRAPAESVEQTIDRILQGK